MMSVSMIQCDQCGQEYPVAMDRCPQCDQADNYADLRREQGSHPAFRVLVWIVAIVSLGALFYGLHRIINAPRSDRTVQTGTAEDLESGTVNEERLRMQGVVACSRALASSAMATRCDDMKAKKSLRGKPMGCFCEMLFHRDLRKTFCTTLVQPLHDDCMKQSKDFPDAQGVEAGYNNCLVEAVTEPLNTALDKRAKRCGLSLP